VTAIPYPGAASFRRLALRTRAVRVVLWLALAGLVLAAAAEARRPAAAAPPLLPANAGGVVVLDLSASITSDTYARIHQTLQSLVTRGGRYGLVLFSSGAYEALPPGTPARALQPLERYFEAPQPAPGEQPRFPVNPWSSSFTTGTQISAGLDLARSIEVDAGTRRPAVLLISDLADDPGDLQRLTAVLNEYQAQGIRLRVVPLAADPNDIARFRDLLGRASSIVGGVSPGAATAVPAAHAAFPVTLVVLSAAVALLLAANELYSVTLRWRRSAA
jgi:hypothetical protein